MKKGRKRMVLRALAAALCLSLCLLSGCRSAKPSSASGNESSSESTAADYSVYEGEWKNSSGDVTLVVEKTHNNSIMFSISKAVSGQKNATLQSAVAKIEDDIAAFEFSDDGYGNSGKGKLIFGKESIICSITVDREDGDQWYVQSIAMDSEKLQKTDPASQNGESQQPSESVQEAQSESSAPTEQTYQATETSIDLRAKNYLGKTPYDSDVLDEFGDILYVDSTQGIYNYNVFTFQKGIKAWVVQYTPDIDILEYDYTENSKTAFSYGGINGNSTYGEAVYVLGTPTYEYDDTTGLKYIRYTYNGCTTDIEISNITSTVTKLRQYATDI